MLRIPVCPYLQFANSLTRANRRIVFLIDLSSARIETWEMDNAQLVRGKTDARDKNSETVLHAAFEVDGRRFFKIFRRAGDFPNAKTKHHGLRDHLIVENEVVGVFENGKSLEQLARKCAEARMVFRQLYAQEQVLKCG
jgi:hypothetical protein